MYSKQKKKKTTTANRRLYNPKEIRQTKKSECENVKTTGADTRKRFSVTWTPTIRIFSELYKPSTIDNSHKPTHPSTLLLEQPRGRARKFIWLWAEADADWALIEIRLTLNRRRFIFFENVGIWTMRDYGVLQFAIIARYLKRECCNAKTSCW